MTEFRPNIPMGQSNMGPRVFRGEFRETIISNEVLSREAREIVKEDWFRTYYPNAYCERIVIDALIHFSPIAFYYVATAALWMESILWFCVGMGGFSGIMIYRIVKSILKRRKK